MEKLLELLNEYEKEINELKFIPKFWEVYQEHLSFLEYNSKYSELLCISKRYGFIQRLVENDKIDTQNLITYMNGTSLTFNKVPSTDCASIDKTWNNFYTECLLMLLSISDTPIEDLVSYLI